MLCSLFCPCTVYITIEKVYTIHCTVGTGGGGGVNTVQLGDCRQTVQIWAVYTAKFGDSLYCTVYINMWEWIHSTYGAVYRWGGA